MPATPGTTIDVMVGKDGKATIETKGFKGAACKDATKAIETALGTVTADTPTNEMYERETVKQSAGY